MTDTFSKINEATQWLEDYKRDMNSALITLAVVKISPVFTPPLLLEKVLTNIRAMVPTGYTIADGIDRGHLGIFYKDTRVTTASISKGLRIFLHLPVVQNSIQFPVHAIILLLRFRI